MKTIIAFLPIFLLVLGCSQPQSPRSTENFNGNWLFSLSDPGNAKTADFDDSGWRVLNLPHDWSIEMDFDTIETGASTGFLPAGIAWYRKHFTLDPSDSNRVIWIEFDGIYRNSEVWINGQYLGKRPNGYSSFSYRLDPYLDFSGEDNVIAVRVDHSTFLDSRWYTGSGIYRNVRLVKTSRLHVPQWGLHISTPDITSDEATVKVETSIRNLGSSGNDIELTVELKDPSGNPVVRSTDVFSVEKEDFITTSLKIENPVLWSLEQPALYTAEVFLAVEGKQVDRVSSRFGIRDIRFDADKGFFLNDKNVKLKGVNLHHDAGCVGAAVPGGVWKRRLMKLQEVGCNAIRLSHNPHDPVLLDLCDEMGFLVIGEAFDEWSNAKEKHQAYLSANDAPEYATVSYNEDFDEWAERDLKDMINRDFNHPSIILWSIGNEVEWTYPHYQQTSSYDIGNLTDAYYGEGPDYDSACLMRKMAHFIDPEDEPLAKTARQLAEWIREIDRSRGITAGCVHPSVGFATGYCTTLDAVGFNYRAVEYDRAHETYPDAIIYGSENWVTWPEWKAVAERDFVAGIFVWTGFAYLGEAGPWPRKGLNISLFDFAGNQTPRGHMYESFWKENPKVFLGTTPLASSEFSLDEYGEWVFTERKLAIPAQQWLRRWEWYDINEHWNYRPGQEILVQAYSNCEKNELFLNGNSLGTLLLSDFPDRVLKWIVPFEPGTLELVGYKDDVKGDETSLRTNGKLERIELSSDKSSLLADGSDVIHVEARLIDENGEPIRSNDEMVHFEIDGNLEVLGVESGSEYSVTNYKNTSCLTHQGSLLIILRSGKTTGTASVTASTEGVDEKTIQVRLVRE
jgi:hypothetical protein